MDDITLAEKVDDLIDWIEDGQYFSVRDGLDALIQELDFIKAEQLRRARVEIHYGDMKEAERILRALSDKLTEDPNE